MANPTGRRALRSEPQPDPVIRPRRGLPGDEPEPDPDARRVWYVVGGTTLALLLMIGVLWWIFGIRDDATTTPSPGSTPATTDAATALQSPSPDPGPLIEGPSPSISTPLDSTAPATTDPLPAGTASPTTASSELPTGPEPEPSPVSSIPGGVRLELNGTAFDMPPGWQLYADELVQGDRRLVRVRELVTDVRIQAVSLTNVTGSLDDACLDLVADHRQLYTGVAEGIPVNVPVTGNAVGVSCNFTGTRASDGVQNEVEFTLLQSEGVTLVFRDTVPTAVTDDSGALAQLVAMECAAAESFGVTIDQCAITPGQADG